MQEQKAPKVNGFLGLLIVLALIGLGIYLIIQGISAGEVVWLIITGIIVIGLGILLATGMLIVQPNEAKVVIFFGTYLGSIRDSGFWFTVPLTVHKKVSLRVRNFNSKTLKVNDIAGNPVEIAAVIVFKVIDSAKAIFDVDNYETFVEIQSETALRHVATRYPYDVYEGEGYSLRGNAEEIAGELARELQERLSLAGVDVLEARLTHLAYATEIAHAMLQRQQASAILAARQIIVEGPVCMAQLAISPCGLGPTGGMED